MAFGDLTGNTKVDLQAQVEAEQAAKAHTLSMATAALEAEKSNEPIDLVPTPVVAPTEESGLEVLDVETPEKQVEFKVNASLENVTIGYGNNYNFEQGQKYKAPESVYNYLEEKGLIWH